MMVNHTIKVYARLKNQPDSDKSVTYEVAKKKSKFDDIIFYNNLLQTGNASCSFRFHKVFDQSSNQEEVFDNVAKPVINSFLQGFNGTIFAYGQTGSGKTYTITGSPKNYNDRGIIPRSIQYIFAQNEKISVKPTIYISYMEIYNEVGYDLLNTRHNNTARTLEELPKIVLLEDGNGEVHIRNMSVLPVTTEQEAMRLLFLGDTNRTIAETPMNEYSSRSHCIFTIYITFRDESSNVMRFSKLHLVDLAGSERVCKSLTTGTALKEAKHINLSLHFLQQVILALSESKRMHVPYRNSMMTYILKDSLSGNCLTVMLATLTISRNNIQETISTCRFAQRVSLISTEPIINEMCDPQQEITFLKNKISELTREISVLTGFTDDDILSESQEEVCEKEVERFLAAETDENLNIEPDLRKVQYCFKLMKSMITTQTIKNDEQKLELDKCQNKLVALQEAIDRKDTEICTLKNIIDEIPENPISLNTFFCQQSKTGQHEPIRKHKKNKMVNFASTLANPYFLDSDDSNKKAGYSNHYPEDIHSDNEKQLFDKFMMNPENSKDINYYTEHLQKKYEVAKAYADAIEQCQKNIIYIRQNLQARSNQAVKNKLLFELEEQQKIYSNSLEELKNVKNETCHLQSGLKRAEIQTVQKFKSWLEKYRPVKVDNNSNKWKESTHLFDDISCCVCSKQNVSRSHSHQECSCKVRLDKKLSLNSFSTYCSHPDICTDCLRMNLCLPDQYSQYCIVNKIKCSNCSYSTYRQEPLHIDNTNMLQKPKILHHASQDLLRTSDFFSQSEKSIAIHQCSLPLLNIQNPSVNNCEKDSAFINVWDAETDKDDKKSHNHDEIRNRESDHHYSESEYDNVRENNQVLDRKDSVANLPTSCRAVKGSLEIQNSNYCQDRESNVESQIEEVPSRADDTSSYNLFKETDSTEFKEFMKTVPLTGEVQIDEEIFNFYRNKFCV